MNEEINLQLTNKLKEFKMDTYKNIQTAIEESEFNFFVISNNEVHGFNTIEEAEQDEEWGNDTLAKMGSDERVELISREEAINLQF